MSGSDSLNMMMMTFLTQTNFVFKSKKLFPVLTQLAIHVIHTISYFFHTFGKSIQNQRMVIQIGSFNELYFRMFRGNQISILKYPFNQYTGKSKIGENYNTFITKLAGMLQTGLYQWKCHT